MMYDRLPTQSDTAIGTPTSAILCSDDQGFTVLELLITLLVMSAVMIIATSMLVTFTSNEATQLENSNVTSSLRNASEQIAIDLREANPVYAPSSDSAKSFEATMRIYDDTNTARIYRYRIVTNNLVREELAFVGGTVLSSSTLILDISNSSESIPIFQWFRSDGSAILDSDPANSVTCSVRVHLNLGVTLDNGPNRRVSLEVALRNAGGASC